MLKRVKEFIRESCERENKNGKQEKENLGSVKTATLKIEDIAPPTSLYFGSRNSTQSPRGLTNFQPGGLQDAQKKTKR
ncbi:uncharacterized protein G2W53_001314 [Senna tora]|uniref:Uncharacterized protein n=1 Tax=Senna tora TaxID=362788 RepID=A0A835CJA8_9FABA|nr:uncharacterized protein G2W53_001314 [Senna tora]